MPFAPDAGASGVFPACGCPFASSLLEGGSCAFGARLLPARTGVLAGEGCLSKKYGKHLPFGGKSVPLQADYYQKRISD